MRRTLPLLSLVLATLAGAPAASAAEQTLAVEQEPFIADAYRGLIAWSSYDAGSETYRLRALRDGRPLAVNVAPSRMPFDLDVGPGPDGRPLVVYARAGDLFQFDGATESPLAEVNSSLQESQPSIRGNALAFARQRGKRDTPVLYVRSGGDTNRQPRPRTATGLEGVELSARGLFATWRVPETRVCCSQAILYRVKGSKLQHVFRVGSGGANFGRLVSPSVAGSSVYFGRTNAGSGQGNTFFRYDLASKRLFSARGTGEANTLTWQSTRFLLSRIYGEGCFARVGAPSRCKLALTDPIAFAPASRRDADNTRPQR